MINSECRMDFRGRARLWEILLSETATLHNEKLSIHLASNCALTVSFEFRLIRAKRGLL